VAQALPSVSVVLVARDECPPLQVLNAFTERLEQLFLDVEFVIVANDVAPATALELKALSDQLPDSLIVFLGDPVHDDLARLIGIDHAVSDYVLFATPTMIEAQSVALLEAPLLGGLDVVIGRRSERPRRGVVNRLLFSIFRFLFRRTTGKVFEDDPAAFRILSRAAALYIATRKEGEVLVRARTLGSGFPTAEVQLPEDPNMRRAKRSLRRDLARGARFITTGSATLLRVSSYLALLGGIASALYAVYVLIVFLVSPYVEPGWTTLSLQLSGMLLLFSVQFLLLSEHVLQMGGTGGISNRRHHIIRELRSPLSRRSARLNIIDEEGRFALGAPAHLVAGEQREDG
jgi:hypothetical protein